MKQKSYEYLLKDYSKIIGIYTKQQELIDSIRKNVYLVEKHMATFIFYDKTKQNSVRDIFNEPTSFLWLLLFKDVITRMPNDIVKPDKSLLKDVLNTIMVINHKLNLLKNFNEHINLKMVYKAGIYL